ncbi:hypothetical protein B0H11DRAFT_2357609 [Mycena galericulata]|nr:hypothetical protein B0H11DRAFT_2357603 [Mycena galericulata]KAJ7503390.1 hypothetical protein B0H11DRAFT_2357609 [Mycena galericulata]
MSIDNPASWHIQTSISACRFNCDNQRRKPIGTWNTITRNRLAQTYISVDAVPEVPADTQGRSTSPESALAEYFRKTPTSHDCTYESESGSPAVSRQSLPRYMAVLKPGSAICHQYDNITRHSSDGCRQAQFQHEFALSSTIKSSDFQKGKVTEAKLGSVGRLEFRQGYDKISASSTVRRYLVELFCARPIPSIPQLPEYALPPDNSVIMTLFDFRFTRRRPPSITHRRRHIPHTPSTYPYILYIAYVPFSLQTVTAGRPKISVPESPQNPAAQRVSRRESLRPMQGAHVSALPGIFLRDLGMAEIMRRPLERSAIAMLPRLRDDVVRCVLINDAAENVCIRQVLSEVLGRCPFQA